MWALFLILVIMAAGYYQHHRYYRKHAVSMSGHSGVIESTQLFKQRKFNIKNYLTILKEL